LVVHDRKVPRKRKVSRHLRHVGYLEVRSDLAYHELLYHGTNDPDVFMGGQHAAQQKDPNEP
jgi:hypothetical protein